MYSDVSLEREVQPGALLSIELDDSILLGEVWPCNPLDDMRSLVQVHVEHSLKNPSALREILREREWESTTSGALCHAS